ncbi:hypothetical protein VIGAN_11007500 [Vigna angularis var. angularis]|uniref:Bifunctional inhibitor/plant lipid transfer protein/seed storage helical domain-containing protein n=1 Tax=Vigna angularis var. angularis TaxID=157739 RepID=A0A0S3T745_PHAAN|nr:hypothetical protein VIGAN_11007500 [Vigna angularis var. angularis]
MMDSISKMMRILCWLLILASELRRSESSDQFLPHSVAVKIANMLTLKQLTLHCRDKNHDLGLIADEVERVNQIDLDSDNCGCILRSTYELPCACELARHESSIIPLGEIHIFEKRPCDVSFGVLSRKCYVWDGTPPETDNALSS